MTGYVALKLASLCNKNNMLVLILSWIGGMLSVVENSMIKEIKLPRKLSDEPKAPRPRRPSHRDVIEKLDRWANSPGLQPPTSLDPKAA